VGVQGCRGSGVQGCRECGFDIGSKAGRLRGRLVEVACGFIEGFGRQFGLSSVAHWDISRGCKLKGTVGI
jgi:hypothetical protein